MYAVIILISLFGQVATEVEPRTTQLAQSALVGEFVQDNYFYGTWWQGEYAEKSLEHQIAYGITPTEYQYFLDISILNLGKILTEACDYPDTVENLAHFLYIEAIKHKAAMDQVDDYLIFMGYTPGPYAEFLYQQLSLLDFAIAEACSEFIWTHDPSSPQEEQLQYFADVLLARTGEYTMDFKAEDDAYRTYLAGIGYVIPDFELFMRPYVKGFMVWWGSVLLKYN